MSTVGNKASSPRQPERIASLSFAQRRLWFLQQLQPDSTAYSQPVAWRLSGELDFEAFMRAADEVVRRQAALRTTFAEIDGEPMQLVWPPEPVEIAIDDASGASDGPAELRRCVEQEIQAPFDLKRGPLFRTRLIRLSDTEHVALFNAHHILWDGWSIEVFRREFAALYQAIVRHEPLTLRELPMAYADFAAQELKTAGNADWDESLRYWRETLGGPLPRLELPTNGSRSKTWANAAVLPCEFDASLVKSLRALSRKHGVTLFMTLLAALKALLHRYTGEEDIVVGAPAAGRDQAGTEDLVGFFVKTLPLRTDVGGDPTFAELLVRVRETTLGAYAHQEVPFERIVQEMSHERQTTTSPWLQVVFGFESGNIHRWTLGDLTASIFEIPSPGAKFDWTILLEETDCGLKGSLEYNTDLFEAQTIERFLQHLRIFLEGAAADAAQRISAIVLLTDADQRLLREWNRTATEYERDATVHEIFEAQVERTPHAIALVAGGREMCYAELNERANALAGRLMKAGVSRGVAAGLCVDRSIEMIVAILGILKAGGVYVPIDASYPRERIEFMLRDTKAPIVVTQRAVREQLQAAAAHDCQIICVDEPGDADTGVTVPGGARAEDLAYVMYTSGSTGQPKGVAVPHRGIVRLVRNTNYARFSSDDVFLQFAPISFDASTFEIWGALLNGAKLVIHPPQLSSLAELGRTIQREGITVLWLTAGLFHQMIEQHGDSLKGVRQLLAGGDVLSVPHVLKAIRELPECEIINGYGPTENTTFTTCYRVQRDWQGGRSVPIGKPVSNTRVHVLDRNLRPVPPGVPGELYVGGDGLALGYVSREELTAKKFIPDPFTAGERLYRTGDLVRWKGDGNLEFLGRRDEQVKIRGYRVELAEIEAVLGQHSTVSECAVVAKVDNSGSKQLAAFIVCREQKAFDEQAIRGFLERKLPAYLLPNSITEIAEIPLTRNGKVDRRALANIQPANVSTTLTPRTETERVLAEIWAEVLGCAPIGIHDNFFHIGGHSLLATQVVSRVGKHLRIELPVSAVFEAPTVAALAEKLDAALSAQGQASRIIPRDRSHQLLAQLDALSDAEVEALLQSAELNQVSS